MTLVSAFKSTPTTGGGRKTAIMHEGGVVGDRSPFPPILTVCRADDGRAMREDEDIDRADGVSRDG